VLAIYGNESNVDTFREKMSDLGLERIPSKFESEGF
jgi:hypothetical protein